jgi:hypothetical protein
MPAASRRAAQSSYERAAKIASSAAMSSRKCERRVPMSRKPEQEDPTAVGGSVKRAERIRHRGALERDRRDAEAQHLIGVGADDVESGAKERGRDEPAAAGTLAGEERRGDAARECQRGSVVAECRARERRLAARGGEGRPDAGTAPKCPGVVGRAVAVGACRAVAGGERVDEARRRGEHGRGVEAGALERADAEIGQEDVGPGDGALHDRPAGLRREIDDQRTLAAIVELEHRIDREREAGGDAIESAVRIARRRRLDLHHVGTPVGEEPARRRTGDPDGELDDLYAFHRSRHAIPPGPVLRASRSDAPIRTADS